MKLDRTQSHLVREGDSPYLIAKKYEIDLSEFLKINNLTPRSTIFPGEIVTIKAK
jgi:membrane-bound lytic murein transglycosylase D